MTHRTTRRCLTLAVLAAMTVGCKPSSESATHEAFIQAAAERVKMAGAVADPSRTESVATSVASAFPTDGGVSAISAEASNARAGVMLTAGRASSAQAMAALEAVRSSAFDLSARAARVAETTFEINAKSSGSPERAIPTINAAASQARGDAGASEFPVPGSKLPSLEAVKQAISRIEGEAVTITKQRDELLARRDAKSTEAASLQQQASLQPLAQRESLVAQAAQASNAAALIARDLAEVEARLARVNQELETQRRIRASIEKGVTDLTDFARRLSDDWREMDQKVTALRDHRTQLVSGGGRTPAIGEAAASLEAAVTQAEAMVAQAAAQLEAAVDGFAEAATIAQQVLSSYGSKATDPAYPARDAVRLVVDNVNASAYAFSSAEANRELARLHANAALALASVRDAVNAATVAGATVPSSISAPAVIARLNEHVAKADALLSELPDAFDSVSAGTRNEALQRAMASAKVDALYGRAVLARLAHAAGLSSELASKRDQLLAEARTEAGLFLQQSPTAVVAEELRDAKPPAEPTEPAAPSE